MPAWDEPSHPMRPCASLSMKSPLGIDERISKRKHRKTPAGEEIGSPSAGFPLICDSIPWRVFVPASSLEKSGGLGIRAAVSLSCSSPCAFGPLQTGQDTAQYNIPKESTAKRPRGGLHFLFRGRCFIFCFAGYPFCGLFLCCAAGTGIFVRGSGACAFAFSDGIPSFGLFFAFSEGPNGPVRPFPLLRSSVFRFSAFHPSADGRRETGAGKKGALPLPFSRSQTVPHKLRYPSVLCAAYLSISV